MGSGYSKCDDKDDPEFVAVDGGWLYYDEYICAIEEKISGGETLTNFEEELMKLKKDIVDLTKQPFDSYNGSLESLATLFSSRFDRLVKVEDFDSFSRMQEKVTAFEFMRGRRYLLLDRILQAQTNMLTHQKSMNDGGDSDSGKKRSVYWNLPAAQSGTEPRDDAKVGSMLSLTMTLSLAKTLGSQNSAMLIAILQNLLQSWSSFEALCFANSNALTLNTVKQFEDFAMDIIGTEYKDSTGTELKSLAVSFLFAIGVLRGSVELISEASLYLMNLNLKLDSRVFCLVKQLESIEPKYAMHFPQKCGVAEKIPIGSIDSSNGENASNEDKCIVNCTICANGSHVYMFHEKTSSLHKISTGGRGNVPGDVICSIKDVINTIKDELDKNGELKLSEKREKKPKAEKKLVADCVISTANLSSEFAVSESKLVVTHNDSNIEHWNSVIGSKNLPIRATSDDIERLQGFMYFEVKIVSCSTDPTRGVIGVGFCDEEQMQLSHSEAIGSSTSFFLLNYSFGGLLQGNGVVMTDELPTFTTGDIIGCGFDLSSHSIFYTKNGQHIGTAFNLQDESVEAASTLTPTISFQGGHVSEVEVNFGQSAFAYTGDGVKGPFCPASEVEGNDDDQSVDNLEEMRSSLAYVNGKIYFHYKKYLRSNQFAVFDSSMLTFLGIETFSLTQSNELQIEQFSFNLATERLVDVQAQEGLVLELVSARVGDQDITSLLREHVLFDDTWLLVSSQRILDAVKSINPTDTILKLSVGWKEIPTKVKMMLPITSYQDYIIGVQHIGGENKLYSAYRRLKFVNSKFSSGSADDDLIAVVSTCWENYLETVAAAKETVLPEVFKADWDFLKKYAKDVEEDEVGLDLEFTTTTDDEDPYECSYTDEQGVTWNDIVECLANEAKDHGDKYRVVFLDTKDKKVKHSFDLELSEAPDFSKSNFDYMELFFNGVQLQANLNIVENETTSKVSSWKFSFKKNGKYQAFEAAEFDASKISYNFSANSFDLSTNTFFALTPDGKFVLRWKNFGASLALVSGEDLIKEVGGFNDVSFQGLTPTGQSHSIMQILDRVSGPYQVSDSSSKAQNARMLKAEIRTSDKKPEVLVTVAGKPISFPERSKESTGVFVVVFDGTFETEKIKFFSLEDEGALSTTRFVEFIENLPLGQCVVVVITDMQDDDLRNGAYEILKSIGVSDLTHSNSKYLIAIGRKGLTPGMGDFISEGSNSTCTLSRLLPPLQVPLCMEPTARTMTNLLTICEACGKEYETNKSENIVYFLTPVLNLLALNLKNITSGLPVKAYWKLLGEDVIKRLEKTLKSLMTSDLKSRPSLQSTITSMFYASMDLLYSNSNQKVEALRAYSEGDQVSSATASASETKLGGDSDILKILLTDVSLPKNYLSSKSRSGVDRNHTTAILAACEGLFRKELRNAVDRYLSGGSYLQDCLSKLYGTVVSVLSSISTNLLALDLQTVGINQGKLILNSPSSMALFLEVFTIMARLSADLLTIISSAFENRVGRTKNDKQLDLLRKDFFSFLETSPLGSILPTVINAFTRLVKAGGYQFTNKIIDEALGLMKELDRCVGSMGKVFALVPEDQAKVSDSVPQKPIKKKVIESEHPYRSNMNEKTVFSFPGATKVQIVFDPATRTETNCDYLIFQDKDGICLHPDRCERFTGRDGGQNWAGTDGRPPLEMNVSEFTVFFHSDGSVEDWGYKFTVTAFFPPKTGARNRLEWIAKMNLDLVEIQSALAVTLVQGPSWRPIEDEYSSWMENSLVRPEYFSFNPDLEDEVDRFLHDLAELPVDTPAAHFLQVMRRRVPVDQGSVEVINRAVYATCAAIIRANNLSSEAYAIATGKRAQPSDALVKVWTTGQKMREYFKLSDVKSSMEGSTNNGVQRKPKFSLYEGAPEEVVEEASKEIVARAQFLLRIPKEKDMNNVISVPAKEEDVDPDQIDLDLDGNEAVSPLRLGSTPKWRTAARGVQMMRQVSEETRKANEIWHSLVGEAISKEKLKNIFEHRRKFAEKNKAANAMTTTEKVLHFVQSDVDIARLHEVNHLRNKRAVSRTKGFDMFFKLLSGLASFPSVVSVVLERFTQTMHKLKREEGTAGTMVHYSTALEGCSPEQNNLLWQKFSAIYKKCVEIIRSTKLDNKNPDAERTILNALHACALDFDSADHTLVFESGVVECLEELLSLKTTSTPAITQSATSLFELLVGRLVIYEPNDDNSSSEPTPLSKKLISALERLLHVGPAISPIPCEATSEGSVLKDKILETCVTVPYSAQYTSVATNTSSLPLTHTIVFWVKRKYSAILDAPFSFANLIGKVVCLKIDENEQMTLGQIIDANADTRKVKVKSQDRIDFEFVCPELLEDASFRVMDPTVGGYLFSKGTSGVISEADRRSRVPAITSIEGILIDDGRIQISYSFDEKDTVCLYSKVIPADVWVQIAVTFDHNNSVSLFVNAEYHASCVAGGRSSKVKELESGHPNSANGNLREVLVVDGSSTLVWFDARTNLTNGTGEIQLTQGDWTQSFSATDLENIPGVEGNEAILRNGKVNFAYNGTEVQSNDWGYKLYYRGVSSKELEEARNAGTRLSWYVGQPPAYVETWGAGTLKGASAMVRHLQVFGARLSKEQLKLLFTKDTTITTADNISEPLLLRRLSVLRRAVNNLENLADMTMKRHFGTSGLITTLFDLMNHRSAIVKCSALQLARSILPQLEREYVDGNAQRQGMMVGNASNFVESVVYQVGESLNTWIQRMMATDDEHQTRPKDGYQYLQSLTAIRLNLIRSFVEHKGMWQELSKKALRSLLVSSIDAIRCLKNKLMLERDQQATLSVTQLCKERESELQAATSVFSLLSLLGGVPNCIGVGATVLYVDSDSGMSEEAIYLGPIEKERELFPAKAASDDDGKEFAAILLKRKGLKYSTVPKASITSPNDISVDKDKFNTFLEECFDQELLIELFGEILDISTVDARTKPSTKEEKVMVEKVFESAHPYSDSFEFSEEITIDGAETLEIFFDAQSATEKDCDFVKFWKSSDCSLQYEVPFSGRNGTQNWPGCDGRPSLVVPGPSVFYTFQSDASNNDWGYKFTVRAQTKRESSNGILKPLPVFSTLVQIKLMGMKSLTQVAACSNDVVRALGGQLDKVIKAAIQPTPANTVMISEKVDMKTLVFESTHPYADNLDTVIPVKVPGAKRFIISFDPETRTELNCDYLEFYTDTNRGSRCPNSEKYTGGKDGGTSNWPGMKDRPPLIIEGDSFVIFFHSDGSVNDWGYKMYVQPIAAKAKAKKVQAIRGAGYSAIAAECSFMMLQGVVLDGLALPADRHYFQGAVIGVADAPEFHERSILSLLQKRDEILSQAGHFVVPTASVNKTLTVKQSFSVAVDEVAVYDIHDASSSVRSTVRRGQVFGVVEEWNDWLKLKEYRDQRNGPVPEPEIGWIQRRTQNQMSLCLTTSPFVQPMTILGSGDDADKKKITSKDHPMFTVQDGTEEQQFFKKLISGKLDDRQLLQQDFPAIEEAMNDYAAIAAGEHAKRLAELLMTKNEDGYNTEDLDLNDLMSYLNISLSEANDEKCVDKERAKRMADAVFGLILNLNDKFGLEETHSAAVKLVDISMDLIKTCSNVSKSSVSAPTQRGYMITVESDHQYENNMNKDWAVAFPGAKRLELAFSEECSTETNCDYLYIYDAQRSSKLYEPKIHGYRSASNKHWPGVGGVPKLVIDRDACIINFVTDGSTVDWGFKVVVYGIYDEASTEDVTKYEEEQKKLKDTSQRMLTMAMWVAHRLAKSSASLHPSILQRFYSEENFRIMKNFSLLPVVAKHRDEMVDILSSFVTNMGPMITTNAFLRQEFVELESSIVNSMRLAYFNETENGTKLTQVSTALQAMVQLVIALHQTMSNYMIDTSPIDFRSFPLSGAKILEDNAFDFGWKTYHYDHRSVCGAKSLQWEIKIAKMGFTMPVFGLICNTSTKMVNPIGKNAGFCEIGYSGNCVSVNGTNVVHFPVPIKNWAVGDVIKITYNHEAGTVQFSVNDAHMPLAIGPAAASPLVEMNAANIEFILAICTLSVGDSFEVRVKPASTSPLVKTSSTNNSDWLSSVLEVENLFRALEGKTLHSHPIDNGLAPYCSRLTKEYVSLIEAAEASPLEVVRDVEVPGASTLVCGLTDWRTSEDDEIFFHDRDGHFLARAKGDKFYTTEVGSNASRTVSENVEFAPVRPKNLVGCNDYGAELGRAEFRVHMYEDGGKQLAVVSLVDVDAPEYKGCSEFMPISMVWTDAAWPAIERLYFCWRWFTMPDGTTIRFLTVEAGAAQMYANDQNDAAKPNFPTIVKPTHLLGLQGVQYEQNVFSIAPIVRGSETFNVVVLDNAGSTVSIFKTLTLRESNLEKQASTLWLKLNAVGFIKSMMNTNPYFTTGAKTLVVGSRVVRGPAWCYGKEDGGCGQIGVVTRVREWKSVAQGGVMVRWESGFEGYYRNGFEQQYDVVQVDENKDSADNSDPASVTKVNIHSKQCLEIPGNFVRVTVRLSPTNSPKKAPLSSESAAADSTAVPAKVPDHLRRVTCAVYPLFSRKVCLEDSRFEEFRKQLEAGFMPKNSATLNALAKHIDKTLQSKIITKDRFFRMKWSEFVPTPEDLVRSALLKELVEQAAIEIRDSTRFGTFSAPAPSSDNSKSGGESSEDKKGECLSGLNLGAGLISEEQPSEALSALAAACQSNNRRRRRSRSRSNDFGEVTEAIDESEDEDENDEEEDEEDGVEEAEGFIGEEVDSAVQESVRSHSSSSSSSSTSSRRSLRADSRHDNVPTSPTYTPSSPTYDLFSSQDVVPQEESALPCGRCSKPIGCRTYDGFWTCDGPEHSGANHFGPGTVFGCEMFRSCNWWLCPVCFSKATEKMRNLKVSGAASTTPANYKPPIQAPQHHVQLIVHAETLFQMIQALNFHLMRAIPMIDLHRSKPMVGTLTHTVSRHRALILSTIKQELFSNALDNTRGSGGQFELFLSRSKARKYTAMGKTDVDGSWSVFSQAFRIMHPMSPVSLRRNDRLYITKLMGEHAQDAGGPYRESFDTYCQELQSSTLSLFVRTANGRGAVGMNREKWVLNPNACSRTELEMLAFVGKLMGIAIRSKEYLALNIPSIIWKLIAGDTPTIEDLEAVDVSIVNSLKKVVDAEGTDAENFSYVYCLTFTTMSSDLREIELIPGGSEREVKYENRAEYRDRVIQYRLHEFDRQAAAVRSGLATIVPIDLLTLFSWEQLEEMVCGKAEIDVELLKSVTEYSSCAPEDPHVQFFWQVMDEFTNEERSALIRFAWGRSRLPLTAAGFSQRFKIQNLEKQPADGHLPEAHTCFFSIDLPRYSTLEITREKLRYVIFNCTAIDGDDTSTGMQVAAMGWEE
jgi:hypothetical protein